MTDTMKETLFLIGHNPVEAWEIEKHLSDDFAIINFGVNYNVTGFLGDYSGWVDIALIDFSGQKSIVRSLITEILLRNPIAQLGVSIEKELLNEARAFGLIHPRITLFTKPIDWSQVQATFLNRQKDGNHR